MTINKEKIREVLTEAIEHIEELDTENAVLRKHLYQLVAALRPFAAFAEKWDEKPIHGMADELYGIHNEAFIRLSDCRAARKALHDLVNTKPTPTK